MLLALAGNVYQFLRAERFEHDVELMQKSMQRQVADVKEAVSGVLEQNLLRYDELSKQLQGVTATTLEQARSEVKRSRSELARTIDRRHQEVVTQLSDLRSDLREDTASKLGQISSDLERTGSELKRVANNLDVASGKVASNNPLDPTPAPVVAHAEPAAHKGPAPAPRKKLFWSKLNPFKYGKKKPEESHLDAEE
jgi:methyl-accepting chemotaxis protein